MVKTTVRKTILNKLVFNDCEDHFNVKSFNTYLLQLNDVILMFLLITLNIFLTVFYCFYSLNK